MRGVAGDRHSYRDPVLIHAVDLKNLFCLIEANDCNVHDGRSAHSDDSSSTLAQVMPFERGDHSINNAEIDTKQDFVRSFK